MPDKKLKIVEIIGSQMGSTREAASIVAKYINEHNSVETLDFTDIEFVSRSFAHELITDLKSLDKNRPIHFLNLSNSLQKMFETVEKSATQKRESMERNLPSEDPILLSELN